jgi:hypothetical protein
MKKHLLMLLVAVMAIAMSLNAQTIVIDDGFENGIQDSVWTQEYVAGHTAWAVEDVEDGLSWPATVKQGSKRAYLRNTTGETQGYITRLVSKVMDLSPRKVYQPQLSFWYANPKWAADRDTLRVLYRTGQNAKWKQLAEYSNAMANWQKVTLELPEVGPTYQIAFEGSDNLGRGIVLDSVKLRSAPECTVPHDIIASNKGSNRVNIAWAASWDANFFEVVVSLDTIDPYEITEEMEAGLVYHGLVSGLQQNFDITLESDVTYFVYIRSICENEISLWSHEDSETGPYRFRVRATKQVPFEEDFNWAKTKTQDPEWIWGNNTGKANPYVNSKTTTKSELAKYSPTSTPAVIFSGGTSATVKIPAGKYVFLATPALADTLNPDFALNKCQVHFWSTVHIYTGRTYGRSLIVGVMDDPEDITTFTPVDTVMVWGNQTFQENIVDLSSYTGTGSFIGFVSDFDRQNLFYIDNVTVEYRPEVSKVTKISVNPRDTFATISWEGNAASYNVLITNAEVDPSSPSAEAIVDQATVSGNSYICTELESFHSWNHPYYVYVQAVGADWSYRYPFVTLASQRAVPYTFDFETSSGRYQISGSTYYAAELGIFGNDPKYPSLASTNVYKGAGCLSMTKTAGADTWITLPLVEDLDSVQVKFFLGGTTSSYSKAHATLGVMTNPMDINTFTKVSSFTLNTSGYTMCYANFKGYTGPKDGVIAIVWDDIRGMAENTINYIDELKVEKLSECTPPQNVEIEIESDSITVSWSASQQSMWEIAISRSPLTTTQKDKTFAEIAAMGGVVYADSVYWSDETTAPVVGIGGLKPLTDYVLYVRTVCGDDAAWWTEMSFSTPCANATFPFKETFNNSSSLSDYGCWQFADYLGTGYPKILSNMLELWSTGTTHRTVAILPPVEGNLDDMMLCFDTRSFSSSSRSVVYVGTMRDIDDQSSFVPFDTIYNPADGSTTKVRLVLNNYNLAYDNIALCSGLGTLQMNSDVYIDNVELKDATCIEAYNFRQTDAQDHSADFEWDGLSSNDQWELRVLNKEISLTNIASGNYDTAKVAVINDTIITGKAFHLDDLQPSTTYYIYIRVICGDSVWTMNEIETACEKLDPSKPNKETFESYSGGTSYSDSYQAKCWTVGNGATTSTSYIPYIYNSTSYSNSGSKSYRMYGYEYYDYVPAYVVSPEIDIPHMKDLAVTFNMYASTSYSWICGVMSDPNDLSSFVVIDSVKGTGSSQQYTYDLSEYEQLIPATAKYFAWRTPYDATSYAYLDDVSIFKMTCPFTKPTYSDLTAQSVRIASGLRTDNDWLLLVSNHELNTDSLSSSTYRVPVDYVVFFDTIDVRSKRVTGLSEQTKYYAYTASYCDSTVSQWSSISFITPCLPIKPESMKTITFATEDGYVTGSSADRYLPCWTIGSKTQGLSASSSYYPYVDASTQYNGHNSLCIYDYVYGTSSNYVGAYAVMPELYVDSISKYQVTFWGRRYSSSYNGQLIIGIVSDPSDLNTFVTVDTVTMNNTTWEPFSVGMENYEGDFLGNLGRNIMFLSEFGVTNGVYIADIKVEPIPTCRPIASFKVDSVGEDAAVVTWKGYQDTFRLLVADRALEDNEKATYNWLVDSIVNHSDHVRIPNLRAATNYYVYAQGICSATDSTDISMLYAAVRTTCPTSTGVSLPFYDDFMSYDVGETEPGCWIFRGSSYTKIYSVTSNDKTYHAVDLYTTSSGNTGYIVVPALEANLMDLQVTFDARPYGSSSTSSATLYMGTMEDPEDPTTFVQAASFPLSDGTSFHHFEAVLGDYNLAHDRLVFTSGVQSGGTSNDIYITNIGLSLVSGCHTPRLKSVMSAATEVEVEISSDAELWDIVTLSDTELAKIRDIEKYLDTTKNKMRVDTNMVTISNLAPATTYNVYARAICGGALGNSAWTKTPLKVHTTFYFKEGYSFGFEKTELWERSVNSKSDNYYIHPALVTDRDSLGEPSATYTYYPYSIENTTSYLYAHTGTGALSMMSSGNYHGAYVVFPAIDEAHARSFEFKVRPAYISATTMQPVVSGDAVLEIGTVEKNKTFDTYEPLVTLRIDQLDTKEVADEDNNYLYNYYTLDVDSAMMADKQLVLHTPKQPSVTTYLYFDDVTLGEAKGYSLVALDKVTPNSGTTALVEWQNVGGPWDLDILDAEGVPVVQYHNLTATSQLVTGLSPRSDYTAVLKAAAAPDKTDYVVTSELSFRTVCQAVEPDEQGAFFWDFDNEYEWEANDVLAGQASDSLYFKPSCFNVGITYETPVNGYQWLVQRKGYAYYGGAGPDALAQYCVMGRDDSPALRVYTTSSYSNSYLVLPRLNCELDTMMIEFYGRCFVHLDDNDELEPASDHNKISSAIFLGPNYSQSLVVGTLTDPNDFSTLQILDTLTYRQTHLTHNDNVYDDPAGLQYWEVMRAPLAGAQGDYIVLFQSGPGLFFLDDLSVKAAGNTLFAPIGATTTDITATSATLSWTVRHPQLSSVVVLLNADGEEIMRDTISGTSYNLQGLTGGKSYQWYVYQTDLTNDTQTTLPHGFITECVLATPDYSCGFEPEEGEKVINNLTTAKQSLCWTYSDAYQGQWINATYNPQNQSNTDTYRYSHTDSSAVMMRASYSYYGSCYQSYIAMPEMDITSYDTLQVTFWMRPAYVSALTNKVVSSYTGSSYSKSIIVGTMTDPEDASTFVAIDTVSYDGTLTTSDEATEANNYLFQQMKVELVGATGPYVAFMTSFYAKGSETRQNNDYLWLDDIALERRQECKAPTELTVTKLGAVEAELSWEGGDSIYILQVSTDPYFVEDTAFVFNDMVATMPYTVTGLEQKTTYYWRVMAICTGNKGESDFAKKESFKTLRSPYFYEPFNTAVSTSEWTFSNSKADDILNKASVSFGSDNSYGFKRNTNNYGLNGSHYTSVGYYIDYNWMITPEFYLPENDSVHFSMDLALTACNTSHAATANAVTESDMANDFYLMVVVSEDGGKTWKSENILKKWQNTNPEGSQLREISATGENVRFSLAAYAGKNVRIGIYREAKTSVSTGIAVHVDNVRLAYFDKVVEQASGCQYEDIVIGDIVLPGETTEPGIHIYPSSNYVTDEEARAGAHDLVYSLEVEVYAATEMIYSDTICEGEIYNDDNFHGKEQEGVYRRKMLSVHGCDSIITLNLHVLPRAYAEEQLVSICPGETYMWNGKPYNRAGFFQDTLVSTIGCDSIETLIVSYVEGSEDTIFVEKRVDMDSLPYTYDDPQHPYVIGQTPIYYAAGTPKGVYVDTVSVQGTQCPTILVHTLTIYDAHEDIDLIPVDGRAAHKLIINDVMYIILNGEWYNAAGQKVADPHK